MAYAHEQLRAVLHAAGGSQRALTDAMMAFASSPAPSSSSPSLYFSARPAAGQQGAQQRQDDGSAASLSFAEFCAAVSARLIPRLGLFCAHS